MVSIEVYATAPLLSSRYFFRNHKLRSIEDCRHNCVGISLCISKEYTARAPLALFKALVRLGHKHCVIDLKLLTGTRYKSMKEKGSIAVPNGVIN